MPNLDGHAATARARSNLTAHDRKAATVTDAPGTPEEGPRRLSPLAAMRQHWKASAGLIALGLVAGIVYGAGQSPTYNAMARVGVGSGTTGQNEVGYIEIALEQVADNDARIVTTNNFVPKLPASVGDPSGVSSVTATVIPDSAIIEIDVAASDRSTAVKAAAYVEQQFIAQVNATANYATPASVLAQLTPLTAQQVAATNVLANAQTALSTLKATPGTPAAAIAAQQDIVNADQTKVTLLNTQVNALNAQYSSLLSNPQPASTVHQITGAVPAGSNKTSLIERYGLVGLAVGALIALGAAVTRDSRRVRAALAAAAPLAAVSDIRPDEAGVEGAAVSESVRAEVRRNRTRGGRPETPASPWGPDADDPYLTQARRTALDAQRKEARARLDAEAEAHRREVRDVLQRMARAAEAAKASTETGLFYPPAPDSHDEPVPGGEPESAPQTAPQTASAPAAEPEPVSAGDVAATASAADAAEAPAAIADETPALEAPAVDVPAVEALAAEVPAVAGPAVEAPAVEVPAQGVSDGAERPMADVRPLFGPRAGSRRIRALPDGDESADDLAHELGEGRATGLPDGALPEDEPFPIFDNAEDDSSYDDPAHAGVHDGEPSGERPSSDDGWRGSGH
jgi:hypothetical protein